MKPIKDPTLLKPGDDLIMRNGTPCRFVAYVPDADSYCRLVVMAKEVGNVVTRHGDGRMNQHTECQEDIGLPPEKQTVWVNVYMNDKQPWRVVYPTKDAADASADKENRAGGKAWPLEIEI